MGTVIRKIDRRIEGAAWDSLSRIVREDLTEEVTFQMIGTWSCHQLGKAVPAK